MDILEEFARVEDVRNHTKGYGRKSSKDRDARKAYKKTKARLRSKAKARSRSSSRYESDSSYDDDDASGTSYDSYSDY